LVENSALIPIYRNRDLIFKQLSPIFGVFEKRTDRRIIILIFLPDKCNFLLKLRHYQL